MTDTNREVEFFDEPEPNDQEFVMETVRRAKILSRLRSGPADASALVDELDISRSTVHRASKTLQELELVRKSNGQFELTGFGRAVAERAHTFKNQLEAARSLEPFLNTIELDDVPVEHFADATVTRPRPRQPHFSVHRIIEMIERSEDLRMFSTVISPFYVDAAHREMLDGMEIEVIFDEEILDIVLSQYQQEAFEALETGNFSVHVHSDVPFELFLFDDRIGMAAHDDSGIARVFVETQAPEAIEWAERLYERYFEEARSVTV